MYSFLTDLQSTTAWTAYTCAIGPMWNSPDFREVNDYLLITEVTVTLQAIGCEIRSMKSIKCLRAFKDEAEYYPTLVTPACRHRGRDVSQVDV